MTARGMGTHFSQDILLVTEIFHSIQGETSHSGLPYIFVRLTGCNLRCTYCDSSYAFHGGTRMRISEIISEIKKYETKHVLITGGEPLMQRNTAALVDELNKSNYQVSIETHGEVTIETVAQKARIVMDIKTPSSGMCRGEFKNNLKYLKQSDEIKFVIASMDDYEWAKNILKETKLPTNEILFSPVNQAKDMPGTFEGINPSWLADKILKDQLPVRLQLQLHKMLWGSDVRGV
jgi:7-carboxy-7-deazaguanine synthase